MFDAPRELHWCKSLYPGPRLSSPRPWRQLVASPQEAQRRILSALRDHFDRSPGHLSPEEVAEMTALPLGTVQNALRVLYAANQIEGSWSPRSSGR